MMGQQVAKATTEYLIALWWPSEALLAHQWGRHMNTYEVYRNALTGPLRRPEATYAMHSVWRPLASPEAGGRRQLLNQKKGRR